MTRSIRLHPFSLALGLVLGGVCLLTMSQAIVAYSPLRIEYSPHPRDMVTIRGTMPYVVPPGKVFVLTGLGGAPYLLNAALKVNGVEEVTTGVNTAGSGYSTRYASVQEVPLGFAVPAGSTIEVCAASGGSCFEADRRAWGYLAPQ